MGGPEALFGVEKNVMKIMGIVTNLKLEDSGTFRNHMGTSHGEIRWTISMRLVSPLIHGD